MPLEIAKVFTKKQQIIGQFILCVRQLLPLLYSTEMGIKAKDTSRPIVFFYLSMCLTRMREKELESSKGAKRPKSIECSPSHTPHTVGACMTIVDINHNYNFLFKHQYRFFQLTQ